jgi:hypothetical protein
LDVLLRLVYPRDTLQLIHFAPVGVLDADLNLIREYYESELRRVGPVNSQFRVITLPANNNNVASVGTEGGGGGNIGNGSTLAETVAEYVNENDPDFFALSPRAKESLSGISEYLIQNVRCSVVLCKS